MRKGFSGSIERAALGVILLASLGSGRAIAQPEESAFIAPLANDRAIGYSISEDGVSRSESGSDAELCQWAINDWLRHSEGRLDLIPADEVAALIRVYFVSPGFNRYGEMRPILVAGRRGAEVYVRPETDSLGPEIAEAARADPLLRDTIVYLTCLHELGHALGMVHTDNFDDVMYFFGFGGDIGQFFGRYRSRLGSRADIARQSGLSQGDIDQLLAAYP